METNLVGTRCDRRRKQRKKYRRYARQCGVVLGAIVLATAIGLYLIRQSPPLSSPPPENAPPVEATDKQPPTPDFPDPVVETDPVEPVETENCEIVETEEAEWYLILVNRWNYIPEDYSTKLVELSNGQSVDERIYPSLQEMFDAARADGVYPIVASGYRTAEKQQHFMDEKIAAYQSEGYSYEDAKAEAEVWVAIPGTSEHQLGIAVDINADGIHSAGYEVYDWLDQNAYQYGFIKRYPSDKTEITGISHEPWHYRYVGTDAAAEIYEQGVCLEEYLEQAD